MRDFRLVLEYDGSNFEGWQIQAGACRTVQGCLLVAAEKISQAPARVQGSGRTDSGVHAEGQVVALSLDTSLDSQELLRALNGNLPRDVVVLSAELASADFDPRRQAVSKLYRYAIWNGPLRSPLRTLVALPAGARSQGDAQRCPDAVGRARFCLLPGGGFGGRRDRARIVSDRHRRGSRGRDFDRSRGVGVLAPHGAEHRRDTSRSGPRATGARFHGCVAREPRPRTSRSHGAGFGPDPGLGAVCGLAARRIGPRRGFPWKVSPLRPLCTVDPT